MSNNTILDVGLIVFYFYTQQCLILRSRRSNVNIRYLVVTVNLGDFGNKRQKGKTSLTRCRSGKLLLGASGMDLPVPLDQGESANLA